MVRDDERHMKSGPTYRLLFDHVPCYITVIGRDFRVLDANERFKETFWRKGARHCYEMYKGRTTVCPKCPALKVFNTHEVSSTLQSGRDKKGRTTHYMVTAAPFETKKGTVVSVIEMAQDVSQVIHLRKKLKQVEQEKLEAERLAAVGQTVAGLAHGIKNILTALEGGMYLLDSGLERNDIERIASGWDMLRRNVETISNVVREYLAFVGGSRIDPILIHPNRIARKVVDAYARSAAEHGVELNCDVDMTIGEAPLDPRGMYTCLAHLVSNAIDACALSEKKHKEVTLSCRERDGTIVFEVRDNGTGMDYAVRKKIFKSFFSTKASGLGSGLGLLITRRIVHEHGGTVRFESKLGKGSCFTIELRRDRLPTISAKR